MGDQVEQNAPPPERRRRHRAPRPELHKVTEDGNGDNTALCRCKFNKTRGRRKMPVLLVPLLVGIPVVIGGGYVIYKIVGG